jgi:hypothetical protein
LFEVGKGLNSLISGPRVSSTDLEMYENWRDYFYRDAEFVSETLKAAKKNGRNQGSGQV